MDSKPGSGRVPARSQPIAKHEFTFTGKGQEYFRVWVVNLVLMVLTLGFYTPYARRRTAVYFYNHSHVAGSPLTFSASIKRMLFGFLVISALYLAYELAVWLENELAANLMLVLTALATPFLWGSAMRFRTRATVWRGLRPAFRASWGEIYRQSWPVFAIAAAWIAVVASIAMSSVSDDFSRASEMSELEAELGSLYLEAEDTDEADSERLAQLERRSDEIRQKLDAPPFSEFSSSSEAYRKAARNHLPFLLGVMTIGLVVSLPFLVLLEFQYRRLFVKRTQIGQLFGHWRPRYADFLRVWLATFGLGLLMVLVMVALTFALAWPLLSGQGAGQSNLGLMLSLFIAFFMLWLLFLFFALSPILAYREARMFHLMWNNIGLGQKARFQCKLNTWRFVGLRLLNTVLTALTLGFYRPFARIAEYRMKFESVTLYVKGDLDELEGQLTKEQGALGDAFGDAIGLDLIG